MDERALPRWLLRGIAVTAIALGLISIAFALTPGYEIHIHGVLVERKFAGGVGFAAFVLGLIGPGVALWARPRVEIALWWSVSGWVCCVLAMIAGVGFGSDDLYDSTYRTTRLWTADAMQQAIAPAVVMILVGLPALWILDRIMAASRAAQRARDAAPPVARIHREH